MDEIQKTLEQRGKRYGEFKKQAKIAQQLKAVMYESAMECSLSDDKKEALEMICTKIARIVNGDPNYKDNWVDIAGYATLVADNLEDE